MKQALRGEEFASTRHRARQALRELSSTTKQRSHS